MYIIIVLFYVDSILLEMYTNSGIDSINYFFFNIYNFYNVAYGILILNSNTCRLIDIVNRC